MSRIGIKPIEIPSGVTVQVNGSNVEMKGSLGTLKCEVKDPIIPKLNGTTLTVERPSDAKSVKALHGLFRSLLANMVLGVSKGFEKELELQGVGYRASLKGKGLSLALGYSHPITFDAPAGISFEVSKKQTEIVIKGMDKQLVGQVAADIRQFRKVEPYKGKGIRYKGEHVIRKAGKSVAGGK